MELRTLASGSSGNCILLSHKGVHLLLDAGISCKRILTDLRELGIDPKTVAGILITHEHSDHIAGLATLTKRLGVPVYASPGTARALRRRMAWPAGLLRDVEPGEEFALEEFTVRGFTTSHDAEEPMGFAFTAGSRRAAVVTDLGYVSDAVLEGALGAQLVVCEFNHDVELLRMGRYPYPLKRRILGEQGHLSNEAGAALALRCVEAGAHTVVLAHLSQENNTPALALGAARQALTGHADITVAVAPRQEPSPLYEV
ncbi:MAG: MBL fold metallo-hydrolase [Oscillospiraceae bacterium]|nr:MBL fold metallo-hydrolase [Oscillospiraceae bacterium]